MNIGSKRKLVRQLLLFVILLCVSVDKLEAYSDKRDLPCANMNLLQSISKDYVEWKGSIQVMMTCMRGFDFALNKPRHGIFTCRPDGLPWDPPIFPDCNEVILPRAMQITYTIIVPKGECETAKPRRNGRNFVFTSELTFLVCPAKDQSCTIVRGAKDCQNPKVSKEQYANATAPLRQGTLTVEVKYTPETNWSRLTQEHQTVGAGVQAVLDSHNITGTFNKKIKAICTAGTIGVLVGNKDVVCRGCSLGHYLDLPSKSCKPCARGYYSDRPLQSSCLACPALRKLNDSALWKQMQATYRDGAYTILKCPSLKRDKHGKITLEKPSAAGPMMGEEFNPSSIRGKKGWTLSNKGRKGGGNTGVETCRGAPQVILFFLCLVCCSFLLRL